MENLASQFINPWAALAFLFVGGLLTLIGQAFISKYVEARAQHTAEGINFPEKLVRTFADEATKSAAARLDASRAHQAMVIAGLMSEIETLLFNWKLTAYFHSDELQPGQTVEDLGIKDLKRVSQLTIELLKSANQASVLLGDEITESVLKWVGLIHPVLFNFHAAYTTSKNMHVGKDPMHGDRVQTISSLAGSEIYPSLEPIGKLKGKIKAALVAAANVR